MQFSVSIIEKLGLWIIPVLLGTVSTLLYSIFHIAIPFFTTIQFPLFLSESQIITLHPTMGYSGFSLIAGILFISSLGLLIGSSLGISVAVSLSEFFERSTHSFLNQTIQLLASIPSVVYGFIILLFYQNIHDVLYPFPPFKNAILTSILFGLMLFPMICAKVFRVMEQVPNAIREGAYALGATRYQTAFRMIIPAYFVDILAEVLKIYARTVSEILIVGIVAGIIKEQTEALGIIFLTTFLIVGYSFYLKRFSTFR